MHSDASHIIDMLAKADIKPSIHRISVMKYLLTHRTHPTVDEIYRHLQPEYPTISRTTIYNTLKLLVEKQLIVCLDIDNTNQRYDYIYEPHAHFLCRQCGRIIDVAMTAMPQKPEGMDVDEIQLNYIGLCQHCKSKQDT